MKLPSGLEVTEISSAEKINEILDRQVEKVAVKGFDYLRSQYRVALFNAWYYKAKCRKEGESE